MSTERLPVVSNSSGAETLAKLASQYGIGPSHFANTLHGLYERHLLFDNGVDPAITNAREHYEAFARSVRDILSQRWVLTHRTYHDANPKRVYYLSMEFLIGRSLANNVTNLMLDPLLAGIVDQKDVDWLALLQKEPDAGLGNGGLAPSWISLLRKSPQSPEKIRASIFRNWSLNSACPTTRASMPLLLQSRNPNS